jgi:3D (Asp-Asp-Asp) domain-containing protein
MLSHFARFSLLALACGLASCATRSLPTYEKPLPRAAVQHVRTTAYTDTESDHLQYGAQSACGTPLQYGVVHSAAADWSRWPQGTVFRIAETGETCQVDDYGWALAGTNTIDLYKPDRASMNAWGTHRVTIEILHWGDPWDSYKILAPRNSYAHVRRMLKEITDSSPRHGGDSGPVIAANTAPAPSLAAPGPIAVRAQMVSAAPGPAPSATRSAAPLTPFYR